MAGVKRMTFEEVVRQVLRDEHADVIRESVKAMARELMGGRGVRVIGAEPGERRPEDLAAHRDGDRSRRWDTRAGEIDRRSRSCAKAAFPVVLQRRKRSEQALVSVVQQCGVSTRRVDQLVESLGLRISTSEASRAPACLTGWCRRSGSGRWRSLPKLRSTNPFERFNREIGRRTELSPRTTPALRQSARPCVSSRKVSQSSSSLPRARSRGARLPRVSHGCGHD
jgi:transposase-like protein